MAMTPRPPQWRRPSTRLPDPTAMLRIRIRPGVTMSLYSAVSRDVSAGAPQAPRVELRPVNETDFDAETGVAEPGTQFPMQQWHKGVTN